MEITLDWFIGFIEGEGSFSWSNTDSGGQPSFGFSQKNALHTIKEIRDFLGFGEIYYESGDDIHQFQVKKIDDCLTIIEVLDGKLRLEKRRKQFESWKEKCIQKLASMSRHAWSCKDEERTQEMLKDGYNYKEIAKFVSHTANAIMVRNRQYWQIQPLGRQRLWQPREETEAKEMLGDGFTYSEVAEQVGKSHSAIKWRNIHHWRVPYCYGDAGFPISPKAKSKRSRIMN